MNNTEYLGQDGLLHCGNCGEPVELITSILGKERKVRCICKCRKQEQDEKEKQRVQEENDRKRMICFNGSMMKICTLEESEKNLYTEMAKNYAENFEDFKKDGKGILLYGTVGTGKSHIAACIANKLIDNGYNVLMTNFASMVNVLQSTFDGKQDYINSLNHYELLILDDLGAERKSDYMQEQVFNIIDSRCRSGLPMIITTNLTMKEMTEPAEIGYKRIYDRILERCFPIEMIGESRRIQKGRADYREMKKILGGAK